MNEAEAGGSVGAEAGGAGATGPAGALVTPPESSSVNGNKRRRNNGGRRRGAPTLSEDLQRIARDVGANKVAPDTTDVGRHYQRSLTFRQRIMEYLQENAGATYTDREELEARAANYAGCGMTCAHRWIFQYTRTGMPFRIDDGIGYVILEAREG